MTEETLVDLPDGGVVIEQPLAQFAEKAYLEYAVSVVKGRALPDVRDGQKPVQRRILHAMNEMRLTATSKHVKSARVVGDVIGKYHPHGDSSVYDAMVRIAQDFSMRYPIVDGQGNFGSRDGDGAAAMRYTECRLTPIAELLLSELDQGTVDFGPNYDGAFSEPLVLPARLPILLLNGASGIAVGMATEIPSHNLREVAEAAARLVRQEDIDVLSFIPGPDFPGGGQLISSAADIRAVYTTGRGSLRMRARWTIEEMARNQWRIIINALPHGVSCQKVLEELETHSNPQPKAGKKAITQEQAILKQTLLGLIDLARDESNKNEPIRIVIEPKNSKVGRDELIQVLLAHTSLETSVPVNLVSIGLDGAPRQKSLQQILIEWSEFRVETVRRRLMHRLQAVLKRLHILEGRKIVFLNLDRVIQTIREAEEPKEDLISTFGLSERQAEDILEIRLRQLARLEWIKIEDEMKRLEDEKSAIETLLAHENRLREKVAREIEDDANRYGDDRRTLIEAAESVGRADVTAVIDEPVTVVVSQKAWVRTYKGHEVDPAALSFKEGDTLMTMIPCRSVDTVIFMTDKGRTFSLPCTTLPNGRGEGAPLASLIELGGQKLAGVLAGPADQRVLVCGSHGYGFVATLGDMVSKLKAGKVFATTADNESILPPVPLKTETHLLLRAANRFLVIPIQEVRLSPRGGKGLQLMGLSDNESLAEVHVAADGFVIHGKGPRGKEECLELVEEALQDAEGRRGSKGKPVKFEITRIEAK